MKILVDKLKNYSICLFFMYLIFAINFVFYTGFGSDFLVCLFAYLFIFVPYLVIFLPLLLLVFGVSDLILSFKKTFYLNCVLCFVLILSVLLFTNSLFFYIHDVITINSFEEGKPLTLLMDTFIYKNGGFIIRTLYAGCFYFKYHSYNISAPCLLTTITFFIVHYYWVRKSKKSDAVTLNPKS